MSAEPFKDHFSDMLGLVHEIKSAAEQLVLELPQLRQKSNLSAALNQSADRQLFPQPELVPQRNFMI